MAMPPHSFGTRIHTVRLERVDEQQWRVTIDEHPLSRTFLSEREARNAVAAEVVRLDAVALALLRRTRSGLFRNRNAVAEVHALDWGSYGASEG